MKNNKVKIYAKALAEVALDKKIDKKAEANFVKLLQKNGLMHKAKEIVQMAEDMILQKKGNKKITFETARKITPSQKKMLEAIAKQGDVIKEKINPELIAGVRVIINDNRQFDGSLQNKLKNIFK